MFLYHRVDDTEQAKTILASLTGENANQYGHDEMYCDIIKYKDIILEPDKVAVELEWFYGGWFYEYKKE